MELQNDLESLDNELNDFSEDLAWASFIVMCACRHEKKEKTATSPSKMTGGEYKVWQPLERAAGTKKKRRKVYFFLFPKDFLRCLSAR